MFAADFMSQVMPRMRTKGNPLGYYEESTDTSVKISHPLTNNLLTIFAEQNNFPKEKAGV